MKKRLVISVLLILTAVCLPAQTVFDTLNLHEFEVIGIKESYHKPYKQTSIDTLVKRELEHFNMGQLLASFSPVFIKSYGKGSISSASFRGTAASHTQVLWNDFAINSPMLGQVDFSYIPESFFDEVELLYGGASMLETSGALGGAVILSNKRSSGEQPLLHLGQSVGSFKTLNTALGINLSSGKFISGTRWMFQSSQNDFEYFNNGILPSEWMTQQNAAYLNWGVMQQFSWQPATNQQIGFVTWNQQNNRNIPPIMSNVHKGGNPEEYQNTFFSRNVLDWLFVNRTWHVEAKAAWFYEDQHYYLRTTTSDDSAHPVTLINSKNIVNGWYGKVKAVKSLGKGWELTSGLNRGYDQVNSNNYQGLKDRNNTSFYGSVKKMLYDRFSLQLLLRAEITDGILLPLMPFAGLNVRLSDKEQLFFRATFSRNYHLPTLNDLYWYPGGNENLMPEDGMEWEGGFNYIKQLDDRFYFSFDVSGYYSVIDNWIQWKPSDYRFWVPQNIAKVHARGTEFSTTFYGQNGNWYYRVSAEYACTKTTDESAAASEGGYGGRQLIYIPVHHGSLFVFAGYAKWSFSWNMIATGERATTMNPSDSYAYTLPSYTLHDVQIGKKWIVKKVGFQLRVMVNNVFDVQYQAVLWRAMPGRNFQLSFKLDLK